MPENGKFLLGRQPILDRSEHIVAYELLFRSPDSAGAAKMKSASHATASVIVHTLSGFGIREVLGGRQGFVNVDVDLLMSDTIEILPREHIGLDLVGGIVPTESLLARCSQLKEAGFSLALDQHEYHPEHAELYGLMDIVKVDLVQADMARLSDQVALLRRHPSKLLAEKVDSVDTFRMCHRLGFDYFQGYYFARPAVVAKKKMNDSVAAILKLLRLLLADAMIAELDQVFRTSPTLTHKLLLLVNSVSVGMREKIGNVRHALTILGRQQLKRWVQLSLYSSDNVEAKDNPLFELAASRAAFMEQLAEQHPSLKGRYGAADQAFMVGILSLLDSIYGVSMEDIVAELNLSEEVRAALVNREGILGQFLDLTVKMERLDLAAGAMGLQQLGLSLDGVIEAQKRALGCRDMVA